MTNKNTSYLEKLHQLLKKNFKLEEVLDFCTQLDVDCPSATGNETDSIIRGLLLELGKNGRLPDFIAEIKKIRPSVDWPLPPEDFGLPESLLRETHASPNQYHVYGDIVEGDKIGRDKNIVGDISEQSVVAVGDRARATLNQITINVSEKPVFTAILIIVVLCFGLIIVFIGFKAIDVMTAPELEFSSADVEEDLIILSPFTGEFKAVTYNPESEVRVILQKRVDELKNQGYQVRLEELSQPITNPQKAREIGELYNATLVIWGEFDDIFGVRTYVEIIPELPILDIRQGGSFLTLPMYKDVPSAHTFYEFSSPDTLYQCLRNDVSSLADYTVLLTLGILEIAHVSPNEAEQLFTDALNISGVSEICQWHTDQAYYWRGISNMMQEQYLEAQNDFSNSIEENSDFWPAHAQLGAVNLALGFPSQEPLKNAISLLAPNDVTNFVIIQSNLCLAYISESPEDSLDCYQRIKDKINFGLVPQSVQSFYYIHLGNWHYFQENHGQAKNYYNEALELLDNGKFPKEIGLIEENLGLVAVHQEDFEQAQKHFTRAKSLYIENDLSVSLARLQIRFAMSDYLQGLYDSAGSKYNEAIILAQNASSPYYEAWAHIGLGLLEEKNHKLTRACEHLHTANEILQSLGSNDANLTQNYIQSANCYDSE